MARNRTDENVVPPADAPAPDAPPPPPPAPEPPAEDAVIADFKAKKAALADATAKAEAAVSDLAAVVKDQDLAVQGAIVNRDAVVASATATASAKKTDQAAAQADFDAARAVLISRLGA